MSREAPTGSLAGRTTPPDSYLICATPRSGSTLLCGLLRSTGVAGRPDSYFRLPDENVWAERWQITRDRAGCFDYTAYVRAAIAAGSTANGVFAARIMWGTMDELVAKLSDVHPDVAGDDRAALTRALGTTRFIHLRRNDVVAQAVSWTRAEQTNYWHPPDAARAHRRHPHFDHAQIHAHVRAVSEHNAAWDDWFTAHGVTPLRVTYEDLTVDMDGVIRHILDFLDLDLPSDRAITPADHRQGDEVNSAWIRRYHGERASG